ncbi:sigma-54-dependent transcriptional regulator [Balneatrix alpica]|uniref:sigma-54-dependent transcriptional regulator n=1 Tax=Balneatrix alpica TaxID=75684 RepID=UPI002739B309|nr:sigma-54 dependent transcriptional regulator [Balneatrix alpica]
MSRCPVILIDDEADIRQAWSETLSLEGYHPSPYADGQSALATLNNDWPGVIITDLRMAEMDGFAVLAQVQQIDAKLPVIMVSGHGDIPLAIEAIRQGAFDFLEKPVDPDLLLAAVARAQQLRQLTLENRRLQQQSGYQLERHLLGNSEAMRQLRQGIQTLASADVNTLIYGETGTGKELVARALHELSPRRQGPFVALNCGALPESLIASELFGHEAGAFTGADRRRIGRLEQASGGTLFLDEIESMPLNHQTQLLRALQMQRLERLGSGKEIPIDIRVVAAAKVDLEEASAAGEFRADLYYRIAVASLSIPPLRQRSEDIPLLVSHYVSRCCERHGLPLREPSAALFQQLQQRPWKGNVRELVNFSERFALGLDTEAKPFSPTSQALGNASLPERLDAFERQLLSDALRQHQGRIQQTADALGIPRKKLYLRMQRYGLEREDFI